jgi:hypothetical protein
MDRLARAFPVLPGKTAALRAFAREVHERRADAKSFYRTYGVTRETWHLQERPAGDLVICCTDIADLAPAAAAYAAAATPFETWFKRQVLDLCGVDPNREPKGPHSALLFEWPPAL